MAGTRTADVGECRAQDRNSGKAARLELEESRPSSSAFTLDRRLHTHLSFVLFWPQQEPEERRGDGVGGKLEGGGN